MQNMPFNINQYIAVMSVFNLKNVTHQTVGS